MVLLLLRGTPTAAAGAAGAGTKKEAVVGDMNPEEGTDTSEGGAAS